MSVIHYIPGFECPKCGYPSCADMMCQECDGKGDWEENEKAVFCEHCAGSGYDALHVECVRCRHVVDVRTQPMYECALTK